MNKLVALFLAIITLVDAVEMQIRPLSEKIGVEVIGLDLSTGIAQEEVNTLKGLLAEHFFVVIRDQHITSQFQAEITRYFGDIEVAWNNKNRCPEDPCIYFITNEIQRKNSKYKSPTFFWHWDKNFVRYPTSVSFAFFDSIPQPDGMGVTRFANLTCAYEELSADLKQKIEPLYVVHSYDHMTSKRKKNYEEVSMTFQRGDERFSEVLHPLMRVHPVTGKRNLNVDELYQAKIIGLSLEEDAQLRKTLLEHVLQEKYIYSHTWKKGDFGMWDNLAVLHRGTPSDPNILRVLRRSSISSRKDVEGRSFLIGIEEGTLDPITLSNNLFTPPLFIDCDSYVELSFLEQHVKELRKGFRIQMGETPIFPHAIVILKGSKWKQSQWICSILDAAIISLGSRDLFTKRVQLIPFCNNPQEIIRNLQDISLNKFLAQEAHERMNNGELADEYLSKVEQIFVQSFETYYDELSKSFFPSRERLHVELLRAVFKNSGLELSENGWIKQLKSKEHSKAAPQSKKPWLLSLEGTPDVAISFLAKLQKKGIVDHHCVVIDSHLFYEYLFNEIPYEHKLKLFPFIKREVMSLIPDIVRIALSNNLNVVLNIPILSNDACRHTTELADACGGESVMVAFYTFSDKCCEYDSIKEEDREWHIYNQLTQFKVCSANWKQFINNFAVTFLVNACDEVIFLSEKGTYSVVSLESLERFLTNALIDADKLANEVKSHEPSEGLKLFYKHLSQISLGEELIPQGINPIEQSEWTLSTPGLAQQLQQLLQRPSLKPIKDDE